MTRLWIGTLRHHFPADFTAMWGAGRLHGEGRDPYFDPVFVDGVYFPRSQFPYGPLVAVLFQPPRFDAVAPPKPAAPL